MPFAPENPLEELLHRAVSDPAARPKFLELLMQSPLFVLGRVEDHDACDEILPSLDTRAFELCRVHVQKRGYHPVFTARSRIAALPIKEQQGYFTVLGRTLFENTRGAAFLINYGSDVGKELLPGEIAQLLNAPRKRDKIIVRLPDPFPGKLTGALGIFFLNRSQVVAAHLVEVVLSDTEPPHLLIGLVAHGDPKRIIAEIGQVADALHVTRTVDVMVLDPASRGELQRRLLAVPPFYARPVTPH
jgi:hypothetical protein